MAALRTGMLSAIVGVTSVRVSAVPGSTFEAPGTSSTSSKVRASRNSMGLSSCRDRGAPYSTPADK